jgi:hypothetical protein
MTHVALRAPQGTPRESKNFGVILVGSSVSGGRARR